MPGSPQIVLTKCLAQWKRVLLASVVVVSPVTGMLQAQGTGELELSVNDSKTKEPVAARLQLRNSRGRLITPKGGERIGRQICFDGSIVLKLSTGHYTFQLERGPEYRTRTGRFEVRRGATDNKQVDMQRFVDMAAEGWYSGDLDINHREQQLKTFLLAEDLRVAAVRGWPVTRNKPLSSAVQQLGKQRFFAENVACDDRLIGRIGFCLLSDAISVPATANEFPSQFAAVAEVRKQPHSHVDVATLTHADLPIWIASKQIDTVGLLNGNVLHETVNPTKTLGRAPDPTIYPLPLGPGRWAITTYYEMLNCGLRIPPSAGSGSGAVENPVGYNRVYVHCNGKFTWDQWWQGLRRGRSVITNGPMLRPLVNGELPGHVFHSYSGETIELEPALRLSTREKIAYLQIIKNGETAAEVRLDELAESRGVLPAISFQQSGWLTIRAVCENQNALRYAMTAPYYVSFDDKPRISRRSCQFFVDWAEQRFAELKTSLSRDKSLTAKQRNSVLKYHRAGLKYWRTKLDSANAP